MLLRVKKGQNFNNRGLNIFERSDVRIKFTYFPIKIWIGSIMLMSIAFYLIYHLALGRSMFGRIFEDKFKHGHWWQYIIAILIGLSGFALIYHSIIETVILDKSTGTVSKGKTSVFC